MIFFKSLKNPIPCRQVWRATGRQKVKNYSRTIEPEAWVAKLNSPELGVVGRGSKAMVEGSGSLVGSGEAEWCMHETLP